jgi:drug/metabolite transporter (DMT)-like permease
MLRVIIAATIAAGSAAYAQILFRSGMKQIGSLENYAPWPLIAYFWHALCNPYIIGGTVLSAIFYFLYLAVYSWAEVTVALPMTAIEFGFAAILAVAVLKESVPPVRWMGIVFVIIGVIFIARSGGD